MCSAPSTTSKDARLAWDEGGVYYVPCCPTCGSQVNERPRRWVLASKFKYDGVGADGRDRFHSEMDVFDPILLDVMVDAANAYLRQRATESETSR